MAVIDRDRWRELARLLDQALELTDDERATWMEQLRSRSPDLAAELVALLAGEAKADRDGFLHGPLEAPVPNVTSQVTDLGAYLQRTLGDTYTIDRELGGGGMSRVFIAREDALGRTVVIKVLLPILAAGVRAERFEREVRLVATLQHPNIVPLFTAGEASGLPYFVMPYVPGESLRARLTRERRLPLHDALSVLRDVARALAFAHEQGVVHRDIKPENVLLAGDAAVVTDFGIAKALINAGDPAPNGERSASELRTISTIGAALGTPAYMAPEQAVGDTRIDHRADIYAWGVLAYELLAGQHPFADCATPQELVASHLSQKPAPLSDRAAELSPMLASLVMRSLEKDPARRPQSAREILDALAIVATPPERNIATRWRARGSIWRSIAAGVGLLAVAVTAVVWNLRRGDALQGRAPAGALSLAVLPFEAVGGDTANAYFAEGIADEIATALSKAGGLRVASPTSVASFRSSHDVDVRDVGRRLGVASVLEGRVRRSGDRMRLTVQLTSVADGLILWSDLYERQVKDVFQVQDQIARSIADALRVRLPRTAGEQLGRPLSSPGTTNPDAYDLYLRGSYLRERRSGGVSKAIEYFRRAIAEDSAYARAYAGLAYALALSPIFDAAPTREAHRQAMDAAKHALALDSTLAEAYTALGVVHWQAMRWAEAGDAYRRAIAADPDYAPGQYHYADYLLRIGQVADAEVPARRARADDPLSATASTLLAYTLSLLGRYDESLTESRRAYELDSSLHTVHARLALAVLTDGRPAEAHALARVPLPVPFSGSAGYVLGATGDTAAAKATLHELEKLPRGDWQVTPSLSYIYLGLGDTIRALVLLEEAARVGDLPVIPLSDPMFDRVRQSARFAAALKRFGLGAGPLTRPTGGRPR